MNAAARIEAPQGLLASLWAKRHSGRRASRLAPDENRGGEVLDRSADGFEQRDFVLLRSAARRAETSAARSAAMSVFPRSPEA